jgi:hypothetical protein
VIASSSPASEQAASTIHRRLLVSVGVLEAAETKEHDERAAAAYDRAGLLLTLGHLLALPEPRVRGAGVSGAKAVALRDLAERFADGRLSDEMLHRAAALALAGLNAALSSPPSSCPAHDARFGTPSRTPTPTPTWSIARPHCARLRSLV